MTVDLGGIVCDYDRVFEIVERKRAIFTPVKSDSTPLGDLSARIQKAIGRIAVFDDCAHSLGASRIFHGKKTYCGSIADFTDFSFHAVKNFTTAEGGASTWLPLEGIDDAEIYHMYQLLSLHNLIERYSCGVVTESQTPEAFVKAILYLTSLDKKEIQKMGRNSRKVAEMYDQPQLVDKLCEVIDFVTKS